jgi:hypothetical protein
VTESEAFALVAVLALAGWSWVNIRLSTSLLPMANAAKVHQAIVDREDVKVGSLVERVLNRQNRGKPPEPSRPTTEEQANPMSALFRSTQPQPGIVDQPDPDDGGLEIIG